MVVEDRAEEESGESGTASWLRRQTRAFVRWSAFWFISLVAASLLFRIGPWWFPTVDFAIARPYIDFFVLVGGILVVLAVLSHLVVDRLA